MGMVNTTITLKPRDQWRPGLTLEQLQSEMDAALQFPGVPNVWTQPIRNRLDMLSITGMTLEQFADLMQGLNDIGFTIPAQGGTQ